VKTLAVVVAVALVGGWVWANEPPKIGVEDGEGKQGLTAETRKTKLVGAEERKGPVVFVGRIASVDATGQVVVVSGNEADPRDVAKSLGAVEDRSFKVGATCRIKTEEKSRAGIKDLATGLEVMLRFEKDIRGNYKAETMEPLGAVEDRQADFKKKKSEDQKRKKQGHR
jgi:hypothetical protein